MIGCLTLIVGASIVVYKIGAYWITHPQSTNYGRSKGIRLR